MRVLWESSITKGNCGWKLLYKEVLMGRVGPKNLDQILEKVQNGLKCLAKIWKKKKKTEILFKFSPCFAHTSPSIDLINLKPFPINFYHQFASKRGGCRKFPICFPLGKDSYSNRATQLLPPNTWTKYKNLVVTSWFFSNILLSLYVNPVNKIKWN